jgi:5-methylcytosine-specific restriction endonuclease McrA
MQMNQARQCSKCKKTKSFSLFTKDKRKLYGIGYCCLDCKNEQIKANYQKRPESRREYSKNYKKSHHENVIAYGRMWYENNKEKARELNRTWQSQNRDRINKAVRERNKINPDKNRQRTKLYRARKYGGGGEPITIEQWKRLCESYGNICLCCKKEGIKLTQDHVMPIKLGGKHLLTNLQPLCKSCNSKKGARFIDYRHD